MKLRTRVSVVALTLVVAVVVISTHDEPSTRNGAIRGGLVNKPMPDAGQAGPALQAVSRRAGPDLGVPVAGSEMTNRAHRPGQYRFRPLDGDARRVRSPSRNPPRLDRPDGDFRAGGAGTDVFHGVQGMHYRFRPLGEEAGVPKRYDPYARVPNGEGGYPEGVADVPGIPDASRYRFRPLDEERPSRRWRGNYRPMSVSPAQLAGPDGRAEMRRDPS